MKFTEYVQFGNLEQCSENGIAAWTYIFGWRTEAIRSFQCFAKPYKYKERQHGSWMASERYRTSFNLKLIY